ncbi:MAG: TonB-dependent receptor [Ignavibacteria bacterium]|nr:TonB-dependent receptor [Ignavibacteria bacterium]
MNLISKFILFIFVSISFQQLYSQQQELDTSSQKTNYLLKEVIITPTRRATEDAFVPRNTSVISKEQLFEKTASTTPDALHELPGVTIQKTNLGGGSPYIRGLTGKQVLILIDGVRFNNSTFRFGPNQYLNTIDPFIINRIEVVRGPGSVQYGSDALGGVINIITRPQFFSPEQFSVKLFEQVSSAVKGSASHFDVSGKYNKMILQVGGSIKNYGDVRAGSGASILGAVDKNGVQPFTGYKEYNFNASALYSFSDEHSLRSSYFFTKQTDVPRSDKLIASLRNTKPDSIHHFHPQQSQIAMLDYNGKNISFFSEIGVSLSSIQQIEGRTIRKWHDTKTRTEADSVRTLGINAYGFIPWGVNTFSAGFELYGDKIFSSRFDKKDNGTIEKKNGKYPNDSRYSSLGIFVQDEISVSENFLLNLGTRYSRNTVKVDYQELKFDIINSPLIFDNVHKSYSDVTWSAEGLYKVHTDVNLFATVSRGFRSPNIDDIAANGEWAGGTDIPNPSLNPEKVIQYETGMKYVNEHISATVSYFVGKYNDLIQRVKYEKDVHNVQLYRFENFTRATISGLEISAKWKMNLNNSSMITTSGNYSFANGKNDDTDEYLSKIPASNMLLSFRFDNFERAMFAEMFAQFSSAQTKLSSADKSDPRIPPDGTPAWNTLNLRSGVALFEHFNLNAGLYNIFDKRYRVHGSGLDAYGRNVVLGIGITI